MFAYATDNKASISVNAEDFESGFIELILKHHNDRYTLMALQLSVIKCCFIDQRTKENLILNIHQLILRIP